MKKPINRMLQDPELKNVQGIIISGYKELKHTCYLFIKFDDQNMVKAWLAGLIKEISSADPAKRKPPIAVNLAFTNAGLKKFGKDVSGFSEEFEDGMSECNRSRRLGDVDESSPDKWGKFNDREIDTLMILQAPDQHKLDSLVNKYLEYNQTYNITMPVQPQYGRIPDDYKEHFGFTDSISQPYIENSPAAKITTEPAVKAGEFILGYLNEYKQLPLTPVALIQGDIHGSLPALPDNSKKSLEYRDFGYNGSYLVFRKLYQDVFRFKEYLSNKVGEDERDLVAAKCVGRWPGGTPLVSDPVKDNPNIGPRNDFEYFNDSYGKACPMGSHIRRSNPRDTLREDREESYRTVNKHRIIRRGVLYGDPFEGSYDDQKDRGIHFVCINADIRRQFEFIQQNWLNNTKFGDLYNERDPIAGNNPTSSSNQKVESIITFPSDSIRKRYTEFPRIVTVRGGGYFFLPSIPALRFLADEPSPARGISPYKNFEGLEKDEEFLISDLADLLLKNLKKKSKAGSTRRDAHPKTLGLLKANFIIENDLDDKYKVGVFAHAGIYKAWIRLSNSGLSIRPDYKKDLRGFAIKLIEVPENNYAADEPHTQDFVLVSVPVMSIGTIALFHDAVRLLFKWGRWILMINWLLKGRIRILIESKKGEAVHTSPLDIRYWSTTPYQFGKEHAVKYSVVPTSSYKSEISLDPGDNYLTENMTAHLKNHDASFDFKVQFFQDEKSTPIENARYRWKEEKNEFIKVATIKIPPQEFNTSENIFLAENLSFSPGHTSTDLKPLGGINRARIFIYNAISRFRHHNNKQKLIKNLPQRYNQPPNNNPTIPQTNGQDGNYPGSIS